MKKNYRKSVIVEILSTKKIHTQEELLQSLSERDIEVTQATLSRDVKDIGAYKFIDANGDSFYKVPAHKTATTGMGVIHSIDISGQACVLRCQPGFASALASMMDASGIEGIMGTIAGDDTILAIMKQGADPDEIRKKIKSIL